MIGAEAIASQRGMSTGCFIRGALEIQLQLKWAWAGVKGQGSQDTLCNVASALEERLELSGHSPGSWGALHLRHLDKVAGAVVDAGWGYPSVYHAGATLVGWLEFGQAWAGVCLEGTAGATMG